MRRQQITGVFAGRLGCAVVVALTVAVFPAPVRAATTISHAGVPPAKTLWQPMRIGPHVVFGEIVDFNTTTVRLRLRNGRQMNVNVAAAVASGNYSAPLFIGKLVCIDGAQSGGVFVATHITRLTNLNRVPADK